MALLQTTTCSHKSMAAGPPSAGLEYALAHGCHLAIISSMRNRRSKAEHTGRTLYAPYLQASVDGCPCTSTSQSTPHPRWHMQLPLVLKPRPRLWTFAMAQHHHLVAALLAVSARPATPVVQKSAPPEHDELSDMRTSSRVGANAAGRRPAGYGSNAGRNAGVHTTGLVLVSRTWTRNAFRADRSASFWACSSAISSLL
jgi:hypothetical protein